jgi:hypothetical protein
MSSTSAAALLSAEVDFACTSSSVNDVDSPVSSSSTAV